jgi:peroxiredoxin
MPGAGHWILVSGAFGESKLTSESSLQEASPANGAPHKSNTIRRHPAGFLSTTNILRALLALCTAAFLAVIVASLRDTSPKEGSTAPAFSITTDSGRQVSVNSFGGKVLVLNFWATWCAPCIEEIPSLNAMQQRFAKSGVVVVAISIDKNSRKYHAFLDRIHVSFDTARDPSAGISERYGTFQYPETYIIKDGKIMRKFPNAENWTSDDLTQYIQSLL